MRDIVHNNKNTKSHNAGVQIKPGFLRQHSLLLIRLCSLVDAAVIFSTLLWVLWLHDRNWDAQQLTVGLFSALTFEIIATFFELYRSWRILRLRYELLNIFLFWLSTIILLTSVLFLIGKGEVVDNTIFFAWFLSAYFVMCLVHYSVRMITRYVRAFGYDIRRVAFVGANEITLKMFNIFREHPWMGMKSIGIFDDRLVVNEEPSRIAISPDDLSGSIDDLVDMARRCMVDIVYICLPLAAEKRIKDFIDLFSDTTVSVYYCPSFFNFDLLQSRWDDVFGQPVISIVESPFLGHQQYLKRLEDLVLVTVLSPVLLPLILGIAFLVKLTSKGPVFFRQSRYGINGKKFNMWKFRTMYVDDCEIDFKQATKNDPRITPFGAFLRRTSLDEIPQFINVLKGEMSVVGPRPHPDIVNEELRKRIYRYMLRHKIKPGITGLAQVSGLRGETESFDKMERRIEQDLQYIRHWSLMLDVKILYKTLFNLSGDNVY